MIIGEVDCVVDEILTKISVKHEMTVSILIHKKMSSGITDIAIERSSQFIQSVNNNSVLF